MILNNYFNFIGNMPRYDLKTGGGKRTADIGLIDTDGNAIVWEYQSGTATSESVPRSGSNYVAWKNLDVVLSSDSSDPTPSDYSVENDITSAFSELVANVSAGAETGSAKLIITVVGTNSSSSAVTITEICVCKKIFTDTYDGSYKPCMFVKQKLDEPVTLAPGESFNKTFEWVQA